MRARRPLTVTRLAHRLIVDPAGLAKLQEPRNDVVGERADDVGGFELVHGPFNSYRRTVTVVEQTGAEIDVEESFEYRLAIAPWWGLLFRWPLNRALRRPPRSGTQPWWGPPDRFDAATARTLGVVCTLAVTTGYLGTVIGQTLTFAADEFGADDGDQGILLAAVRVGALASVAATIMADRRGRRPLAAACLIGSIAATAIGAMSPGLVSLGVTQTVARGLATGMGVLLGVVVAETLPAGSRAYGVSVTAMAAGLGSGMVLWLLPLADLDPRAWRIIYLAPILFLPMIAWGLRALPETARFIAATARHDLIPEGRGINRRRLVLLGATNLMALFFLAPASQFQNEFLRDERGFSGATITAFVLLTTTPASIAVFFGGRIADRHGRRTIAAVGLVGVTVFTIVSYLSSGWVVWVAATLRSAIGGLLVPALGVYGPELFGTRSRARANGLVTLIGVVGSSSGLLFVGAMSDTFGSLGEAFLLAGLAPLAVAVLVVTRYPETSGVELEELNPADRSPDPKRG